MKPVLYTRKKTKATEKKKNRGDGGSRLMPGKTVQGERLASLKAPRLSDLEALLRRLASPERLSARLKCL
nr:hypothetical protein CFP56_76198 [Quercus suber]